MMGWFKKKREPKGLDVKLTRDAGKAKVEVGLRIKRAVYVDWVVEFEPITLLPGESLEMTWNVMMYAYTNGVETDAKPFKKTQTFRAGETQTMVYSRFTMVGDEAKVRAYEELPALPDINAE